MSTAKAQRFLLERLSHNATALLSLHLELPAVPAWADGEGGDGRAVLLVGAHALRVLPSGDEAVGEVLASLRDGTVPDSVLAVAYAPKASEAFATLVADEAATEVLIDGPRGTGKTQIVPGALAWLAEQRVRGGFPVPLLALWLHESLTNATAKTMPSLLEPFWGGVWTVREGGTVAVLTLGGVEMVRASFVATEDDQAAERARAACHVVVAEEAIASMREGGISERVYEVALTSMQRLPTPRPVAAVTTNPGSPESWPYKRFIEPGRAGCVRCAMPASDRLTPEQDRAQHESFRDAPDLERRLAGGEWCGLLLGAQVAVGFSVAAHVAPRTLQVDPYSEVWMGWDSGGGAHCHATIIGQRVGGEARIFACLISEEAGIEQHLRGQVLPWLSRRIPSLLDRAHEVAERRLLHRYDPTMDTTEGGDIEENAVRRVRRALGGSFHPGKVAWGERIGPLLDLFRQGNGRGGMALQIDPGEDTALLRRALAGEWYYRVTQAGTVARDLPAKPNHPFEDAGDSLLYFVGGIAPQLDRFQRNGGRPPAPPTVRTHYDVFTRGPSGR